jgi:hypothetical protein
MRCGKKRDIIYPGVFNDSLVRFFATHEDNTTRVHYLSGVDDMGVHKRCNEERMGGDVEEHFADKIARKRGPHFPVETVFPAEYFGVEDFLHVF